jgi:cold shock CspA family protein
MQRPLKITSRDFTLNAGVEAEIRDKAAALETFYPRLSGCEVVVRAPAIHHHHKGGPFLVELRLTLPGKELTVNRQAEGELSVAIREAFDAAKRQIEDYGREQRGSVKTHVAADVGRIVRIQPELDCGFIETPDGREIYFHRNSVVEGNFDKLQVGAQIRFVEEQGDEGPQASSLYVLTK